jgi:arylsulfatase B
LLALTLQLVAGVAGASPAPAPPDPAPNLLVVVLDDMGVDTIGAYGAAVSPPPTPVIDQLAASGVVFDRAWAAPMCSPSRAALLTGKHGFRLGIGNAITEAPEEWGLDLREVTIASRLRELGGYATAAFGKWHLSDQADGHLHPNRMGFGHYDGCLTNLDITPGLPWDYYNWPRVVDGVESIESDYLTSATIDAARDWIRGQERPWFAFVALHAVHSPFHWPPSELHSLDPQANYPGEVSYWQHRAMVESVDTELGRLIDGLGIDTGETALLLVSDNGTASPGVEPPFDPTHGKSTLYEGGVRVPLIAAGAGVTAAGTCSGLVHVTDFFATLVDLAGLPTDAASTAIDSVSMAPYFVDSGRPSLRPFNFAERFRPNGPHMGVPALDKLGSAKPGAPTVCQETIDLGPPFSSTQLSLCGVDGQGLAAGNLLEARLDGAAPASAGLLILGKGLHPQPFLGSILAAGSIDLLIPFVTGLDGTWSWTLSGDLFPNLGPGQLTLQAVSLNPAQPFGNDLSNALLAQVPPYDRKAVTDEAGYKLVVTAGGGKQQLYHLPSDPLEANDLVAQGESGLTAEQAEALSRLRTHLELLLASHP